MTPLRGFIKIEPEHSVVPGRPPPKPAAFSFLDILPVRNALLQEWLWSSGTRACGWTRAAGLAARQLIAESLDGRQVASADRDDITLEDGEVNFLIN